MAALSHVKSDTIGDFTGTITGFNSQGSTTTINATDLVRPVDWNSAHNFFQTIAGNTAGQSTASGTNLVLGGTNGIQLSHSTGASIATLWIQQPVLDGFNPYPNVAQIATSRGNGTFYFDPMRCKNITMDRVIIPINNTNSSNSSGSHTLRFWVGIYSKNVSTLSLVTSQSSSTALTHSGTAGSYSLYSGQRLFTMPLSTSLPYGDYWLGFISSTSSAGANGSYSQFVGTNIASIFVGLFGVSNNTTQQLTLGQGVYTASTTGIPGSVAFSHIRGSDSNARNPNFLMFANGTI